MSTNLASQGIQKIYVSQILGLVASFLLVIASFFTLKEDVAGYLLYGITSVALSLLALIIILKGARILSKSSPIFIIPFIGVIIGFIGSLISNIPFFTSWISKLISVDSEAFVKYVDFALDCVGFVVCIAIIKGIRDIASKAGYKKIKNQGFITGVLTFLLYAVMISVKIFAPIESAENVRTYILIAIVVFGLGAVQSGFLIYFLWNAKKMKI